jgi:hypothetical protein
MNKVNAITASTPFLTKNYLNNLSKISQLNGTKLALSKISQLNGTKLAL